MFYKLYQLTFVLSFKALHLLKKKLTLKKHVKSKEICEKFMKGHINNSYDINVTHFFETLSIEAFQRHPTIEWE